MYFSFFLPKILNWLQSCLFLFIFCLHICTCLWACLFYPLSMSIAPHSPWPLCLTAFSLKYSKGFCLHWVCALSNSPAPPRWFYPACLSSSLSGWVDMELGIEVGATSSCLTSLEQLGTVDRLTHTRRGWKALKEIIIGCMTRIFRVRLCSALNRLRLILFLSHLAGIWCVFTWFE